MSSFSITGNVHIDQLINVIHGLHDNYFVLCLFWVKFWNTFKQYEVLGFPFYLMNDANYYHLF